MAITLRHEGDNIFRVDVSRELRKQDFDAVQRSVAAEVRRRGKVRLLVVLAGFEGWDRSGDWHDLSFYMQHGDDIERIAIVGDDRWRGEMLMFAAADLRAGAVEFFTVAESGKAHAWLAA